MGVLESRGVGSSRRATALCFCFVAVFVAIGVEVIICRGLLGNVEEIPPERLAGLQFIR